MHGDQRAICRSWFSLSIIWVPEIKLRFGSKYHYLVSHIANPKEIIGLIPLLENWSQEDSSKFQLDLHIESRAARAR